MPHSPGPWTISDNLGHRCCYDFGIRSSDNDLINLVCETLNPADAALIAAFPDLLEACKAALDQVVFFESRARSDGFSYTDLINSLRHCQSRIT